MKKLHLLILRSFIGPFILIFFIVLFVLLMQFLWRYIDELVGKGLSIGVIGEFLLYTSASLVTMALPLAILMSSLMTFGNLGEKYELTAIKASGISLQRVMMPLILVVVLISIGAFFFANEVLPYATLELKTLLYDIRQKRPELQLKPGEFYNGIEGYSMRIGRKNQVTNTLYDVKIYNHSEGNGNSSVTIADSGAMVVTEDNRNLIFTLYDGYSYNELQDRKDRTPFKRRKYPHSFYQFDEYKMIIKLVGFNLERTDQSLFKNNYAMMNLKQLTDQKDSVKNEMHERQEMLGNNILRVNLFKKREHLISKPTPTTRELKQIKQLTRHDSLAKFIKERAKQTNPPPTVEQKIKKKESTDTLITRGPPADLDSLFSVFTLKEKMSILSNAQTLARSAKNYIDNTASSLDIRVKLLRRFEIEWHRKFTVAFACLVFLFIGAPLGAIIRKGGLGLPLVLSTLFFIFYYILSLTGEKLVRESIVKDYQGMWMASSVFFIAGIFLTYKATTDSSILNFDTYSNYLKKLFGHKYNLIDSLAKKDIPPPVAMAKTSNILNSLDSLLADIDGQINTFNDLFKPIDYLMSVFTMQGISNLLLFERLYKNIMRSIIHHPLYNNRRVREKLLEFPDFNYKNYLDSGFMLVIKIIIAIIPIVNFIILIRHYIILVSIKNRLILIQKLTEELKTTIQLTENS